MTKYIAIVTVVTVSLVIALAHGLLNSVVIHLQTIR